MNSNTPLRLLLKIPLGTINQLLHDTEVLLGHQPGTFGKDSRLLEQRGADITGSREELGCEGVKVCQTTSLRDR